MVCIAVVKEQKSTELRVAVSAETVKKFVELGAKVEIESGAGEASQISDQDYKDAGASISNDAAKLIKTADILLGVQPEFSQSELSEFKKGGIIVGLLNPFGNQGYIQKLAENNITAFSMEFIPRITRAQSMDVLSSQSNLAGYKAVLDAFNHSKRVIPMMMTAAGTIKPAKALILGAGVAGLQAIATAKRLGAIVSAFDVRPAVKEQVESLGAKFIEVEADEAEDAETAGGYAKEMSDEYKKKQEKLIHEAASDSDIIITTALIPGKPAPILIPESIVKDMRRGSIIVDMAVSAGGNCPLSELDQVVEKHGVTLVGYENIPSRVPVDASALYSRNIFNFVSTLIDAESKELNINEEDEIIQGSLMTKDGKIVNKMFLEILGKKPAAKKEKKEKSLPKKTTMEKPHLKKKVEEKNKKASGDK
jgi:NAD(P) transhydrogenase subunit alpha